MKKLATRQNIDFYHSKVKNNRRFYNRRRKELLFLVLSVSFLMFSCEKEINLNLPEYEPKIVVEGAIESEDYAWVFISKNHGYLDGIDFSSMPTHNSKAILEYLNKYIVLPSVINMNGEIIRASELGLDYPEITVIVSDGAVFDTLQFEVDSAVYSGNFVYPPAKFVGKKIKGELLKKYDLIIHYGDKTYTSTTSIPRISREDFSARFVLDAKSSIYGGIHIMVNDNPVEENFYRFYFKRIGRDNSYSVPQGPALINDMLFNGKSMELPFWRTWDDKETGDPDERGFFRAGDNVSIKICTLDHDHYWFWITARNSSSNFFGQPEKVKGNISGGALGVWGGYGVTYINMKCVPE